jgi:hypothetical protein
VPRINHIGGSRLNHHFRAVKWGTLVFRHEFHARIVHGADFLFASSDVKFLETASRSPKALSEIEFRNMIEITRSISFRGKPPLPPIETRSKHHYAPKVFGRFSFHDSADVCWNVMRQINKYISPNTRSTLAPAHIEEHIDPAFQPLTKRNCDHNVVDLSISSFEHDIDFLLNSD